MQDPRRKPKTPPRRVWETEVGTLWKRWNGQIKVALAYPNRYAVGMSNLGFHAVYGLLNGLETVLCERVFLSDEHPESPQRIQSVESERPLSAFDVVAFSIAFENDYPNILSILEQARLPLRSHDRRPPHPLIIAGGVACILNPEPIAAFIDCFLIGEAESLLPRFFAQYDPRADRTAQLRRLAGTLPGVYVPEFYRATYAPDGTLSGFHPTTEVPEKITRVIAPDFSHPPVCSVILSPDTTFDRTFLIEVSRGCPHGCRFCAAGFAFRPARFRPRSQMEACITTGAQLTSKIGLVGAAVSDHPHIGPICRSATDAGIRLSFSSLRADAIDPAVLTALCDSGVKTATIAPDAGSERMRRVINKGITEAHILDAAERLVANGIPNLKLYFMVGLPFETGEDVDAVVTLCKRIKHCFLKSSRARQRMGEITVSLNAFVPKPHTPFQWSAMETVPRLKEKINRIKQGLKAVANVRVHSDVARWAYIQGILSRGDRKVAGLLLQVHDNRGNWPQSLKSSPINPDFYVYRQRQVTERLPWDFIDHGVHKRFLIREYERAARGEATPACPASGCTACGVCR